MLVNVWGDINTWDTITGDDIPIDSRKPVKVLNNYLKGLGYNGSLNDNLVDWLEDETLSDDVLNYNDLMFKFLESEGYTSGSLNDRVKKWSKG